MKLCCRLVIVMKHGRGLLLLNQYTQILGVYIPRHRNMLVPEAFLSLLIRMYGKHIVYSDGDGTWYLEACVLLNLKHRLLLHSSYEKSIVVERTIEYLKDR